MLLVAAYVAVEAVRALLDGSHADTTVFGVAIAAISLAVLPPLGVLKMRVARGLESQALRGDGVLTLAAATLAGITLVALLANSALTGGGQTPQPRYSSLSPLQARPSRGCSSPLRLTGGRFRQIRVRAPGRLLGRRSCLQAASPSAASPSLRLAVFFSLSSWELGVLIFAVVGGACVVGVLTGRFLRANSERHREPIGALQGALLGVVGLILAFGLSLAVGRYQDRRADVVSDANTIGTAYLRAQTIAEPQRTASLALLRSYNDLAIRVTHEIPGSAAIRATSAQQELLQRRLWHLAGESLNARPRDSAPRLYVDSLNAMIDQQNVRLSGLNNRVPNEVLWLELLGAAVALGLLALYLSVLGRGMIPIAAAAVIVSFLVLVTFDLDRPTRGLIEIPATPLLAEKATMSLPPAAPAPR